jgi:hypothetical protein
MNFRAEEYDAGAPETFGIHHTNQREEEKNWTAGQASKIFLLLILNLTLVFVAPPFAKGTYSQAHSYYVLDRKALNFFKCW